MPINGRYAGNADNVSDDGSLTGWAPQPRSYGAAVAGRPAYCFGPVVDRFGTWGQFIYENPATLAGQDMGNPTGLNGLMPANFAPDNSIWVQGHLINGECGGSGTIAENLTPISHNLNMLHKPYEATLQRLVNAGPMRNAIVRMFNPHGIANSRIIYRTHCLPEINGPQVGGAAPSVPGVPKGLVVSLGIVVGGIMRTEAQVRTEFKNDGTDAARPRWFARHYYLSEGRDDRNRILVMLGGVELNYR